MDIRLLNENVASVFGFEPKLIIFGLAILGFIYWITWLVKIICLSRRQKDQPVCPNHFNKELAREFVKHEDNLVDHRITWLLTSQALLFAALGFLLGDEHRSTYLVEATRIISALATIGIIIAIASITSLFSASCAVIKNSPKFKVCYSCRQRGDFDNGEDVVGYRVNRFYEFLTPSTLLPIMFIFAWYVVAQASIPETKKIPEPVPVLAP